jgi:aspartate aminotransferase-like enzyme
MGINSSERNVIFALDAIERAFRIEGHPIKKGAATNAAMDYFSAH